MSEIARKAAEQLAAEIDDGSALNEDGDANVEFLLKAFQSAIEQALLDDLRKSKNSDDAKRLEAMIKYQWQVCSYKKGWEVWDRDENLVAESITGPREAIDSAMKESQ